MSSYRFGFNGMESDDEVSGTGNSYDFGARIYDPRVGRFLSIDPLVKDHPHLTPYQFADNTPIWAIDFNGLDAWKATSSWSKEDLEGFRSFAKAKLKKYDAENVKDDCADLAVRLMVDYAEKEKLPLTFTTTSGGKISSMSDDFENKQEFLEAAQNSTDANTLRKDVFSVDESQAQEGDMRINIGEEDGEEHGVHVTIISDYEKEEVTYGNPGDGGPTVNFDYLKNTEGTEAGSDKASRWKVFKNLPESESVPTEENRVINGRSNHAKNL